MFIHLPNSKNARPRCIADKILGKAYFSASWARTKSVCLKNAKGRRGCPVHKLLGRFSATLGFFDNFQLVEQLSMHQATSKFLCLYSHSHAPATSEKLKSAEYKNITCVENIFVQSFSFTIR